MREVITYDSWEKSKVGIKSKNKDGFRPLHHDLINDKWKITFVKGVDDPSNFQQSINNRTKAIRMQELNNKLRDDSITFNELKELLRNLYGN